MLEGSVLKVVLQELKVFGEKIECPDGRVVR
jgi:hypothetical protein